MKQNLGFAILLVLNSLSTLTFLTFSFMRNLNFMEVYFTMPLRYFPVLIIGIGSVVMEIIAVIHLLRKRLTEKINKMIFIVMLLNIVVCPFLIVDNILFAANRYAVAYEYPIIFLAFLVLCISAVCSHLLLYKAKKEQWHIYKSKVLSYVVTLILSVAFVAAHMFALSSEKVMLNKFNQEFTAISYFGETPKEIIIPDSVTSISDRAFSGCSSLTSITIPDSVTSIGDYAFYCCRNLTNITIPDSVTSIGNDAFHGCPIEKATIPSLAISYVYNYNNYYVDNYNLKEVVITSGESIGDNAFYGCSSLTSITIPDSVTSIGDFAFDGCTSLTSITIPDSVTSIGDYAFSGCSSLTSITIPDSVTSIGGSAFSGCPIEKATIPSLAISKVRNSKLKEVIITSGESIGYEAFYCCNSLTSITIPDSVTSIGYRAFYGCSSLTSVYYLGTAEEWEEISIDLSNTSLPSATRYYYSENQPTKTGNYWHYDQNGGVVVW